MFLFKRLPKLHQFCSVNARAQNTGEPLRFWGQVTLSDSVLTQAEQQQVTHVHNSPKIKNKQTHKFCYGFDE